MRRLGRQELSGRSPVDIADTHKTGETRVLVAKLELFLVADAPETLGLSGREPKVDLGDGDVDSKGKGTGASKRGHEGGIGLADVIWVHKTLDGSIIGVDEGIVLAGGVCSYKGVPGLLCKRSLT